MLMTTVSVDVAAGAVVQLLRTSVSALLWMEESPEVSAHQNMAESFVAVRGVACYADVCVCSGCRCGVCVNPGGRSTMQRETAR